MDVGHLRQGNHSLPINLPGTEVERIYDPYSLPIIKPSDDFDPIDLPTYNSTLPLTAPGSNVTPLEVQLPKDIVRRIIFGVENVPIIVVDKHTKIGQVSGEMPLTRKSMALHHPAYRRMIRGIQRNPEYSDNLSSMYLQYLDFHIFDVKNERQRIDDPLSYVIITQTGHRLVHNVCSGVRNQLVLNDLLVRHRVDFLWNLINSDRALPDNFDDELVRRLTQLHHLK